VPFLEGHGTPGKLEVKSKAGLLGKSCPVFSDFPRSFLVPCGAMTVIGVSTLLRRVLDSEERAKEVMTEKID